MWLQTGAYHLGALAWLIAAIVIFHHRDHRSHHGGVGNGTGQDRETDRQRLLPGSSRNGT